MWFWFKDCLIISYLFLQRVMQKQRQRQMQRGRGQGGICSPFQFHQFAHSSIHVLYPDCRIHHLTNVKGLQYTIWWLFSSIHELQLLCVLVIFAPPNHKIMSTIFVRAKWCVTSIYLWRVEVPQHPCRYQFWYISKSHI